MTWIGSPNYTTGRAGKHISLIVVHWIVGDVPAADAVFTNPARQTSAHYALNSNTIHQYVLESNTAWHAGNLDINQRSIGIEHRGGPTLPIDEGTYETSSTLIAEICKRYGLNESAIHAHREYIATACPGTLDLNKLKSMVKNKLTGADIMTIGSGENWYGRLNKLHQQVRGVPLDRAGFGYWVGKPLLSYVEAVSDHKNADEWQENGKVGAVARKDDWQGQIYTLQKQFADATKVANDLQARLVASENTTKALTEKGR